MPLALVRNQFIYFFNCGDYRILTEKAVSFEIKYIIGCFKISSAMKKNHEKIFIFGVSSESDVETPNHLLLVTESQKVAHGRRLFDFAFVINIWKSDAFV